MADILDTDGQAEFRDSMAILNSEDAPETSTELAVVDKPVEPEPIEEPQEIEGEVEEQPEPKTVILHRRPTVKEVKASYPEFFKKFPDMQHMLFREQEYASLFPTIEDAKMAAEEATTLGHLRDLVTNGGQKEFEEFLGGVKDVDGLKSMAANFLPALYNLDRNLYFKATQPIALALIQNAFRQGMLGNENLKNAALVISQFAFGDVGYASGDKKLDLLEPKKGDTEVDAERKKFYQERYVETKKWVDENAVSRLRQEVARGFDPNNAFPEYTRNLLLSQVVKEIDEALTKDTRHMATINSMWKQAHSAGFAGTWKDRILSTYLSGARSVMPAIRARVRSAAVGDLKKESDNRAATADRSADRREVKGGSNTAPRPGAPDAKAADIDWSRTSDMDFLNGKVTLKKR